MTARSPTNIEIDLQHSEGHKDGSTICLGSLFAECAPQKGFTGGSKNFDAKPLGPNSDESHQTNDTNQVPKSYAANITALKLSRFYYDNLAALAAGEAIGVELAELKPFNSWMACIKQLKLLCCEFCRPSNCSRVDFCSDSTPDKRFSRAFILEVKSLLFQSAHGSAITCAFDP